MIKIRLIQLTIIFACLLPTSLYAATLPEMNTVSHILVDYQSGQILAAKDEAEPRAPASMTKMMSAIIIFDQLKQGKLTWDEQVTISSRAAAINESEIKLVPGEKLSVKELVTALFVQSANDATVALAEHIAGSEEAFVQLMNQKAEELQLDHTQFQNSTGLPAYTYPDPPAANGDGEHVMSAADTAHIVQYLLKNYPQTLEFSSITNYTFHQGTTREESYDNWDLMLPTLRHAYDGVDGLKTGHTNAAGYCSAGTAERDGFRVISVVMGTDSENARFLETKKLLDYAYDNFQVRTAWEAGKPISGYTKLAIQDGVERTVSIAPKDRLQLPMQKENLNAYRYHVVLNKDLKAPLEKGRVVGSVELRYQGKPIPGIAPTPMITVEQAEKGSFLRLFFRKVGDSVQAWIS